MVNEELKQYIEENIFPIYEKNDKGHQIDHIEYVIHRSFFLCKGLKINPNMLFTAAAYHDIGHHIDAKRHELISAQILLEDKNLKKFFNEEQLSIMKEAIEDHRASLKRIPRNIYGKIVSSADRNTDVDASLRRIYFYNIKNFPKRSEEEVLEECYRYAVQKFGKNGYAKFFLEDKAYENYLKELQSLFNDKNQFIQRLKKAIATTKNHK